MIETSGGILLLDTPVPRLRVVAQSTVCRTGMPVSMLWALQFAKIQKWPPNTASAFNFVENRKGPAFIAQARNHLVARALASQSEDQEISHFAWLDDDVITISPDVWKCLLHHDVDICAGVYFTREEFSRPLIFPANGSGPDKFIPNRFYDVWGAGMGLTLVKADVYRTMARELDLGRDENGNVAYYKVTPPFDTEDLYFFENAAQLETRVCVDTSHHAFGFHHDLKTNKGYPEEQWNQFISGQPIVWESATWQPA